MSTLEMKKKPFPLSILTCSHHFIDGDARGVQLLGKLVHSLARVLVCVGVYIGPDTWQTHCSSREQIASGNDHFKTASRFPYVLLTL